MRLKRNKLCTFLRWDVTIRLEGDNKNDIKKHDKLLQKGEDR